MTATAHTTFSELEDLRLGVLAAVPSAATARLDWDATTESVSIANVFDDAGRSVAGWRTALVSELRSPRVAIPFNTLLIAYPEPTTLRTGKYTIRMDLHEPVWARVLEQTWEFMMAGFEITDEELSAALKLAFAAVDVPAEQLVVQLARSGEAAAPSMLLASTAGTERLSTAEALKWSTRDPDKVNLLPWALAQGELHTPEMREATTAIADELAARHLGKDPAARRRTRGTRQFAFEL